MTNITHTSPPAQQRAETSIEAQSSDRAREIHKKVSEEEYFIPKFVRSEIFCLMVGVDVDKLADWTDADKIRTIRDYVHGRTTTLYCLGDGIYQKFCTDERVRAEWNAWDDAQFDRWSEEIFEDRIASGSRTPPKSDTPAFDHTNAIAAVPVSQGDPLVPVDGTTVSLVEIRAAVDRGQKVGNFKQAAELINSYIGQSMARPSLYHHTLDLIVRRVPKFVPVLDSISDFPTETPITLTDLRVLSLTARLNAVVKHVDNSEILGAV